MRKSTSDLQKLFVKISKLLDISFSGFFKIDSGLFNPEFTKLMFYQ